MNIGNLLVEADSEVAYDEPFESFGAHVEDSSARIKGVDKYQPSQILQEAAHHVAKIEAIESKQIFKDAAKEASQEARVVEEKDLERRTSTSPVYDNDYELTEALNVLVEASVEVAGLMEKSELNTANHVDESENSEFSGSDEGASESEDGSGSDEEDNNFDDEVNKMMLFAIHSSKIEQIQKLLNKDGLNLKYQDRHGWSALHWAASTGNTEVIEIILDHRKVVQHKNVRTLVNMKDRLAGWTPLHVAAVSGHRNAIKVLLENGANKKKRNFLKELPFDVVGHSKNAKAIRMMLDVRRRKIKVKQESKDESKN